MKRYLGIVLLLGCFSGLSATSLIDLKNQGYQLFKSDNSLRIHLSFEKIFNHHLPPTVNAHLYRSFNTLVAYLNDHRDLDVRISARYPRQWARRDQQETVAHYARAFGDFLVDAGVDPERIAHTQDTVLPSPVFEYGAPPKPTLVLGLSVRGG